MGANWQMNILMNDNDFHFAEARSMSLPYNVPI